MYILSINPTNNTLVASYRAINALNYIRINFYIFYNEFLGPLEDRASNTYKG